MKITDILLLIVMIIVGGLPSVFFILSIPVVIGQKIYHRIKDGTSIWD